MAELSLESINVLFSKAEARDKFARLFQYGARGVVGVISIAQPKVGSRLNDVETKCRALMTNLAGARRTHRWFKELPVLKSIPASLSIANPVDRVLDVITKIFLASFFITDHVGHLKQWKLLPGGKRAGSGSVQLGLKFFCVSNIAGAIYQMRHYLRLSAAKDDKEQEKDSCVKQLVKHLLLIVQTAHVSTLYPTHDAIAGFFGVITSYLDVQGQWPAAKPKALPAAPTVIDGVQGKPVKSS
mmetsp:Transcript_2574/g.5476  ORF Transcript_2574/g.5476 Transcript_2574/m.5476 type:complete len:242 (-) Transcript_2574:220-945(-)